ncbi:type II toxin-antitoxin system VapC family toxin [Bosea sp. (in: a-proteobacteria)]|uniref:type II toxin-antitoxin system VapC family toxin n=1 Tax=Bosea sp. (in: a-proteobacteria) TaxID=1871050 RepID=UPI002733844D|nr:type II toxin-antitoxin system VapC family toxin [Bosea sp. (in: a-proteobacteria)]MDP3411173.1 type II toxin-antitoxin system VapC family toxin [Bosea sp. (in: a-proteobacteria)]
MNEPLVLDANIIVKLLVNEPRSEIAQQIFDDDRFVFYTPAHALAEVIEVLCRKVRRGEADERQLREALIWLPGSFVAVPVETLIERAVDLAIQNAIGIYDALYVALALDHDIRLVTDDQRLANRLRGYPASERVVLLEDALRVL